MRRVWLMSDLHRDVRPPGWRPARIPDADLAIIAGDVGEGLVRSVAWVAETIRPHMEAVLVAGNHEFHGSSWGEEILAGRQAAAEAGVHLLENDTVEVQGMLVSGATLWVDWALDGLERRRMNMASCFAGMRDHRRITWRKLPEWRRFRPEEALNLHVRSVMFLDAALSAAPATPERPHLVVTHHAPSARSVPPRFAADAMTPAFASDLDAFILRTRPTAWFHGHLHDRADYRIGGTRIVANPHGYPGERTNFDPEFVIDV